MSNKNIVLIYWAAAIKNIVVMICWTALAIYFGKWWIALFATCCLSNVQMKSKGDQKDKTENDAIDSSLDKP